MLALNPSRRAGTLFEPELARIFVGLLLGLPVIPMTVNCRSCCTRTTQAPVVDPYGMHYATCRATLTPRHTRVRDVLASVLRWALAHSAVVTERVPDGTGAPVAPGDGPRPIDVGYLDPVSEQWCLFDIIIRGKVDDSMIHALPAIGTGGPASLLASAGRADKQRTLQASGFAPRVSPLSFGAFGGIDAQTRSALDAMHSILLAGGCEVAPSFLTGRVQFAIWRQLCVSVYRAVHGEAPTEQRPPRGGPHASRPGNAGTSNLPSRVSASLDPADAAAVAARAAIAAIESPPLGRGAGRRSVSNAAVMRAASGEAGPAAGPAAAVARPATTPARRTAASQHEVQPVVQRICGTAAVWAAMLADDATADADVDMLIRRATSVGVTTFVPWSQVVAETRARLSGACAAAGLGSPLPGAPVSDTLIACLLDSGQSRTQTRHLATMIKQASSNTSDASVRTLIKDGMPICPVVIEERCSSRAFSPPPRRGFSPDAARDFSSSDERVSSDPGA
jgi:hypothetical protein